MLRTCICAVLALMICVVGLIGAEFKGKWKGAKGKDFKGVYIIVVNDKDQEIIMYKETKVYDADGNEVKPKERKNVLKKDVSVEVKTEKKDDKEVALEIKVKK